MMYINHTLTTRFAVIQRITEDEFKRFKSDCESFDWVHVAVIDLVSATNEGTVRILAVSDREIDQEAANKVMRDCVVWLTEQGVIVVPKTN